MNYPLRQVKKTEIENERLDNFICYALNQNLAKDPDIVDEYFRNVLSVQLLNWEDLELTQLTLALVSRPAINKEVLNLFMKAAQDDSLHLMQFKKEHQQELTAAYEYFKNESFETTLCAYQFYLLLLIMPQKEWLTKEITRLAVKDWKRMANFVKESSEVFLWRYFDNINIDNLPNVTEQTYLYYVSQFFAYLFQKPYCLEDPWLGATNLTQNSYYHNSFHPLYKQFKIENEENKLFIKTLDSLTESVFPEGIPHTLRDLALNLDDIKAPYELKLDGAELQKILLEESSTMQIPLADLPITKQDIQEILQLYFIRLKYKQTECEDIKPFTAIAALINKTAEETDSLAVIHQIVTYGLYIKVLLREYQATKTYAISHYDVINQYTAQLENQQQIKQLHQLQAQLKEKDQLINNLQNQNRAHLKALEQARRLESKLKERNALLAQDLKASRKEILNYEAILDQDEDQVENQVEEDNSCLSLEEKAQQINAIGGLIFGGTKKWQERMSQLLPGWQFISREQIHFDENLVRNAPVVVVNIMNISHTLYYRIRNIAIACGRELDYLNMNTNIEITTNQLYQIINK